MVKQLNTRIAHKHDLEVNWLSALDFIPLQGELIIYDSEIAADGTILELPEDRTTPFTYERLKIGNGHTLINDLPFVAHDYNDLINAPNIQNELGSHNADVTAHSDIRTSLTDVSDRVTAHDNIIDSSIMIDKSFGNGPDTVAEGNHIHGDIQLQIQSVEEVINSDYYDTSESAEFFTDITPSHTVWKATSSSLVTDVNIIGGRYVCTTSTADQGLTTDSLPDLMEVVRGKTIVGTANLSSDNYTLYIKMYDGTAWSFGRIKSTDKIITVDVPENVTQFKFGLEYKGDGSTPDTCEVTNFAVNLVNDVTITSTANIPNRNYTIWSWNDEEIINAEAFATFCNAYKINRVYQHISTGTVNLEQLRKFVGTMQKNRVSVNWLTGDPSWALSDHHYYIADQIQKVVSYNMSIQNEYEKIGTIQFDIEPYTLAEWETDQAGVIKQYQDAVVLMHNESIAKQLSLNVCIASWFDNITYDNEYGQGSLFDFVSKHSSSTVIMAYNNRSYVAIAENEIRMSAANGKNVAVGLETHSVTESVTEDITFANKPIEDLYRAFETLFLVYKMYGVYKGYEFVIHDYEYFKAYTDRFNLSVESGDILSKLTTENKTDLISAINEINTEVESLKTSVSEGKALIASAVTDKGVKTADNATFTTMAANIRAISSDATITSGDQLLEGVTAYGKDGKVTGTIPSQEAKTLTPTRSSQVAITAGTFASGDVTVNAIPSNWIPLPEVIKAGDYPIYGLTTSSKVTSTTYTDLDLYIFTVNRAGTYRFKWCCMKPALQLGGSGTPASALFLNDVAQFENTSFSDNVQYNTVDVTCNVGDVVRIKAKHSGGMYATYVYGVHVCIEWEDPNAFFV